MRARFIGSIVLFAVAGCGAAGPLPGEKDMAGSGGELDLAGAALDLAGVGADLSGQPADLAGAGDLVIGGAPVGDPCKVGGDCQTGECHGLPASKLYMGGYCTILDCGMGKVCPPGSACKDGGEGKMMCLKICDPLSKTDCRLPEGYGCCGGGPMGPGWCAPTNAGICQ